MEQVTTIKDLIITAITNTGKFNEVNKGIDLSVMDRPTSKFPICHLWTGGYSLDADNYTGLMRFSLFIYLKLNDEVDDIGETLDTYTFDVIKAVNSNDNCSCRAVEVDRDMIYKKLGRMNTIDPPFYGIRIDIECNFSYT